MQGCAYFEVAVVEGEHIATERLFVKTFDVACMLGIGKNIAEGDVAECGERVIGWLGGPFHAPGHVDFEHVACIADVDVLEAYILYHAAP